MSRLPYLRHDQLDEQQVAVWDRLVTTRKTKLVNEEGGLQGPFNAWVHAPDVGAKLADLGAVLRFSTSIERRLTEVAIITMGARWKAEFEWWAHARMAQDHGVPDAVVDAIGRDETPSFAAADEAVIYQVAHQLAHSGVVDDAAYGAAQALLGDAGMVELVSLCGFYALVCFTLNAFAVPLPTGEQPNWPTR